MSDLRVFLKKLIRHWASLVMGGVVFAFLSVGERLTGRAVPKWMYGMIVGLAIAYAAFETWREERDRANALGRDLDEQESAASQIVVRDTPSDQYWLLAIALAYGLRREPHTDIGGATSFSIWIGDTPIYLGDTRWFYDLVTSAEKAGLLSLENRAGGISFYRIAHEAERIVEVERRRKRPLIAPAGILYEARTGKPVEIKPPF